MADENQTTTESTNSQTPTPTPDATGAGAQGGTDATAAPLASDAGDADRSLLGAADSGAGSDDKSGEALGDDEKPAGEQAAAPETYELTPLTIKGEGGEDVTVEIDNELLTAATPVFKEVGLTNEQANKLAPLAMEVERRVLSRQADDFTEMKTAWAKQVQDDPELGGKNINETSTLAARALDHFGAGKDSEFRKLLDETGLGNHPVMVRMFRDIGRAVGEDSTLVREEVIAPKKTDRLAEQYPDDVPQTQK